ncbi:hypothetical protein QUA56_34410 [Microcoleus sp. N3A4]|uniref:hypothetical protein n=1 Tax=Microcoleus sp. N3A4 TaxID=3055379 RepID=UPI002FD340B2
MLLSVLASMRTCQSSIALTVRKFDRPYCPKVRSAYNFSMTTTVKLNRAIGIIKKSTSNTVN